MKRGKGRWLVTLVLVLAGCGIAAGVVLPGRLSSNVAIKTLAPFQFEEPIVEGPSGGGNIFTSLDVDHQSFRVIIEVESEESYLIKLPMVNDSAVDTKARLTLSYPSGVLVAVSGSGVIDDIVPVSYHAWKFTMDADVQGGGASPYDGVRIEVGIPSGFDESSIEITGSMETISGVGAPNVVLLPEGDPYSDHIIYLHSGSVPPSGDTISQANLVMDKYTPTAGVLYNYTADMDSDCGRTILSGGSGVTEANLAKYQSWQIPVPEELSIDGDAKIFIWSASKGFHQTKRGIVTAYLRDLSDGIYSEIGNATLDVNPWQQGSVDWVEREIVITGINYTVPAGHILELKLIVGSGSSDIWLAYDTIGCPSRIVLPSAPPAPDFSADPTSGYEPLAVEFADLSTSVDGIVTWLWDFGDGETSTEQNPTYVYSSWGTYTVSLTVTEFDGDSRTETKTDYINVGTMGGDDDGEDDGGE